MEDQERKDWETLVKEEEAKRLLTKYELQAEHYRRARNWLIFICIALVIAFGVLYQNLYQKWQEEKAIRTVMEYFKEYYEQDSEHYRQLYYDCLNPDEKEHPWSGAADEEGYWWEK